MVGKRLEHYQILEQIGERQRPHRDYRVGPS